MSGKFKTMIVKRKSSVIGFFTGVVFTLLIAAIIATAISPPAFLTDLFGDSEESSLQLGSDNVEVIIYRMFPKMDYFSTEHFNIISSSIYLGEIRILPDPPEGYMLEKSFIPCNGQSIKENRYKVLREYMSSISGQDVNTIRVPDLDILGVPGFSTYITASGYYPTGTQSKVVSSIITDDIIYLPCDGSYLKDYKINSPLQIGEIVLLSINDPYQFQLTNNNVHYCSGNYILAHWYPEFKKVMFPDSDKYLVPLLKYKSPIQGAQYYIVVSGQNPFQKFQEAVPEGQMRCVGCKKFVPYGIYCIECGTKNN